MSENFFGAKMNKHGRPYRRYEFLVGDLIWIGTWNEFRYETYWSGTKYGLWHVIVIDKVRGTEFSTKNPIWYGFWNGIPMRKN